MIAAADGRPESSPIEYWNSMLQYYLHIPEPDQLPDEVWALKIKQLENIRKSESK